MAQERPNRLVEWYELIRRQGPILRERWNQWLEAVREEPILIWHTGAIRYAAYGLGLIVASWVVISVAGMWVPAPPAGAMPRATTAYFHVLCTDPNCGHHFVVERPFGFQKFPIPCSRCGKLTGFAARPCHSDHCRGVWVVPVDRDGQEVCPRCGHSFK